MKTNKKLTLAVTLSLLVMQPYAVFAANADSFRTDEYYGIGKNVFDLINAADAYAQGYTGKGVTVGVADIGFVNIVHPEFAGKDNKTMPDKISIENSGFTWADVYHPTHVAGIVAANKDGNGMHGVAFDSCIVSSSAESGYSGTDEDYSSSGYLSGYFDYYAYYLTDPDIKIINNSWGYTGGAFISLIQNEDDFEDTKNYALFNNDAKIIAKAVKRDKLLIFASGNDGHLNSDLISDFDILYGDKAYNDNIITVTAVKANSFTKNDDGRLSAGSDAIAIFSNLAMYNEDTALSAPGWNIFSTNADFENPESDGDYFTGSGTSMAAPVVTGVGALVQQAFPYLGGKQIGDVLLSTANKNIEAEKKYFVTLQADALNEGTKMGFNIYFTGTAPESVDKWGILYEYYKDNEDTFLNYFCNGSEERFKYYFEQVNDAESFKNKMIELFGYYIFNEDNITIYQNIPLDVIFGQGIVDAGSAVKGLGAINVRRLDSSDISDKYSVVANDEYTKKQAIYKVDTQGYNSVWSNDISEIRAGYISENPLDLEKGKEYDKTSEEFAGLTDLHDRWLFYTTNNFDNNEVGSADHNWMTNHYMEQYNKWVAQSGLLGLHAGLYKTGEGVLALTGNNTYKGASIAAGGTLQIDGSVAGDAAGDAYSEGAGTIAGSGTINGSLYNNGTVEAGSWGAVTDDKGETLNLKVGGNFEGSGVIAVNTDGEKYATINVGGNANISEMSLKAGTFAAPGTEGTFLNVGENGSLTGTEKLNTDFSGLLNSEVENNGNELKVTTSINNNAGISAARFNAINSLYSCLSEDEQQEMYRLYALDNNELRGAMQNISASEGMHLELARDAMQNRDVRQAVTRQQHLERNEAFWAISGKSWGDTDYGVNRHSFNLTLGHDFYNDDDAYAGVLFAYSDNSVYGNSAEGEYDNYTAALYGGTKNKPGTVMGYVSYGVQDNEMTRHLGSAFSHSGLSSKVESDYDSSVIGVGAKYAYDLHYGKEGWHLSPFAALDYAHYKQDSFTERGSVFGVHSGGFNDNYLTGELGLALDRQDNNGKYGFSLAYKRILDGDVQNTDFAFAKGGTGFGVSNTDGSKNHIIAEAYIGTKLSDKWEIGGSLEHDWSSASRDLSAVVQLNYYF